MCLETGYPVGNCIVNMIAVANCWHSLFTFIIQRTEAQRMWMGQSESMHSHLSRLLPPDLPWWQESDYLSALVRDWTETIVIASSGIGIWKSKYSATLILQTSTVELSSWLGGWSWDETGEREQIEGSILWMISRFQGVCTIAVA